MNIFFKIKSLFDFKHNLIGNMIPFWTKEIALCLDISKKLVFEFIFNHINKVT